MFSLVKVCILLVLLWGAPANAQSKFDDSNNLLNGLSAIKKSDWVTAKNYSNKIIDPVGQTLLTWARLRAGDGKWFEYKLFLKKNPQWPGLKRLRKRAEVLISKDENPKEVLDFFRKHKPQTGIGALRLSGALRRLENISDANKVLIDAWINLPLSADEQLQYLDNHKSILIDHHIQRMDNLLWRGDIYSAIRILSLLPSKSQTLAKARVGLQRGARNVDNLIAAVPASHKKNAGLAYDRFQWRIRKDRWDEAHELLVKHTGDVSKMERPEKWASRRRGFARRSMRANKPEIAYFLASGHRLNEGSHYADLEWLSGYISLIYLSAPLQAERHFKNFSLAVSSSISRARAGYWLGRVNEKLGNLDQAAANYLISAKFQTAFYGQLAAERLGLSGDPLLRGLEEVDEWPTAGFVTDSVFDAAKLLHSANKIEMMRWFMTHMAETLPRDELLKLSNYSNQVGEAFVTIGIAKEAAKRGIILPKPYYPVTELATLSDDLPPEVIMSIARRESELNLKAISPAGALGLMQIMPSTARQVSKGLGLKYSKKRLTSDWRYNAILGASYLENLIKFYDGSYILAFAAYNAGSKRVNEWIEIYGDPRDPDTSVVDWIEHIPYKETRNYVMRVTESLLVYRARITGSINAVEITKDLNRG